MATRLILAGISLIVGIASAADYLRDIKPVLKARCYACHGGSQQKAGLRLDTAAAIRKGAKAGPVVSLGKPAESELLARITSKDLEERMPSEGKPLKPSEIAALREWIAAGLPAPTNEQPEANPRDHWSFKPIQRPPIPQSDAPNPIDAFINVRLTKQKVAPLAPAEKNVLLRRVYIDLIGLPPTREQLKAFNQSARDDPNFTYKKVVDELLASPQYGERWGRHWMDIWRYSDWYGRRSVNDVRNSYPHIWRWRDWIINSLNTDKGYDRMILEMLAADEIAPTDDAAIAATGFIVRNWFSLNYNIWMQDQVEHTGKAFLGLTMNCALCHDHKYDPISQKDYFAFRAFFEPLEFRHDRVPGGTALPKYVRYKPGSGSSLKPVADGLPRIFDEVLDAKTRIFDGGDYRALSDDPPVLPGSPAFLGGDKLKITPIDLPLTAWYPGLKKFVQKEELAAAEKSTATSRAALDKNATALNSASHTTALAKLESLRARLTAENARDTGRFEALSKAAYRAEHLAILYAANEKVTRAHQATAAATKDTDKKKAQAQLATARKSVATAETALKKESTNYTLLSPTYPKKSSGRRTALARWIASSDNPLTARVAVNHIWARHFHKPFAEPVYDFGRKGTGPTHPMLLDWLAAELIKNNWRMKPIHRLIVTSEAYRRASTPSTNAKDPDNKLLWRMNPGRGEAEVIHDSILHVAGTLDTKIGGPEIPTDKAIASRRRALYFSIHPEAGGHTEFIALFDAPDPGDCYRRTTTIIPQQALAMVNSTLTQQQSRVLARKLWETVGRENASAGSDMDAAFVTAAFEQILTRSPKQKELQLCRAFLEKQTALFEQNTQTPSATAKFNHATPSPVPDQRARESLIHSLFSHNDFITTR